MVKRKTLGRLLYTLISRAVNITGTFDPDENLYIFEEELTSLEYNQVKDFLNWVHSKNKVFGRANYEEVYQGYLKDTE